MIQKTFSILAMAICACLPIVAETGEFADPLATPSGFTLGIQGSDYTYKEPTVDVKLSGSKLGITASYTMHKNLESPYFRFELRYSDGRLKYEGSGTMNDVPDKSFEARVLFGKDFLPQGGYSLTPYAGLAYRYLHNDLRGRSSTGLYGYRRTSNYTYLPVGLTMRFHPGAGWILAPTAEFDVFLGGRQETKLSDVSSYLPDISNTQEKGYGYRASFFIEKGRIAFGPWLHYWKIQDSEVSYIWYEPKNWTREIGAEFRYQF